MYQPSCQNTVSWIGELIMKRINYLSKDEIVLPERRIDAENDVK